MKTETDDSRSELLPRPAHSALPAHWNKFLCVLFSMYGLAVLYYIFNETRKPTGAIDFHAFWYAGHFILQGQDPYEAYFTGKQLELPIRYLDGVVIDRYPVAQEQLSPTPANTPLMLLIISLLSHFSWNIAKWWFCALNLSFMLITAWIALRKIPFAGILLERFDELLLLLVYFDFTATRIAIENGQTTLLVFMMMLLAILLAKRSWALAGLALGIALSKYSLALAVFVFFLYKRHFKILFVAVAVQLFGILALAAIGGNSPMTVVQENLRMFSEILRLTGIHLAQLTKQFTRDPILRQIPVVIMTILVFGLIFVWVRKHKITTTTETSVLDFHVMTICFIWMLLVGYHRQYDTLVLLLFIVLIFKGLAYPNIWNLSRNARLLLLAWMTLILPILVLPARLVETVLPGYYGTISDSTITIFLLTMLAVCMFLTRRFLQIAETETIHERVESHDLRTDP